jgi:UDP-N-acetylmuramyl pentapeptide phosphotransferase/UDP-N-acetylglucosamine-1-phosphate transferase
MEIVIYLIFTVAACILAFGIMPLVIRLAEKQGIIEGNDERKTHTEQVSSFGGIGIMAAFSLPIIALIFTGNNSPLAAFGLAIPLFAISLLDDIFGLKVTLRFAVHAAIGLAVYLLGFSILPWHINPVLGASATMLFTMLLINAYNLIDGINGLAGGLGVIASLAFGTVFSLRSEQEMALASFSFAGAMLGFLHFNFGKKAMIFMGDNGSTVLGFLMALMAMAVLNGKAGQGAIEFENGLALILAVVAVPVVDVFKVALMRAYRGKSPFSPDRTHIHHLFTDNLLSHPTACAMLFGWTLLQAALAICLPAHYAFQMVAALAIVPYLMARAIRFINHLIESEPKREALGN